MDTKHSVAQFGVCISDYLTQDIISLNDKAKQILHLVGSPDRRKSYEIISEDPDFVLEYTTAQLKTGEYVIQEISSACHYDVPLYLKSFLDLQGDRYVRIDIFETWPMFDSEEMALYLSEFTKSYEALQVQSIGNATPAQNIADLLLNVGRFYDADRAYVLELDLIQNLCTNFYEWRREDALSRAVDFQDRSLDNMPSWKDAITAPKLQIDRVADLQETNPQEYETLSQAGVTRLIGLPVLQEEAACCFLCLENPRRFWNMFTYLQTLAHLAAQAIGELGLMEKSDFFEGLEPQNSGDVVIRIFGQFEIHTKYGVLTDAEIGSSQSCMLLLYLLLNRHRVVPARELAEILWPYQLLDNPYNSVKGAVYRARKVFKKICPAPLMIANNGTYELNSAYHLLLDYEEFDRLVALARQKSLTQAARGRLYQQALSMFRGRVLPNLEAEPWLMGKISYYTILFAEVSKEYLLLLREEGKYAAMFQVASSVLSIESSDDEIHYLLIESLMKKKKFDLARSHFQKAERILTDEQKRAFQDEWNKIFTPV